MRYLIDPVLDDYENEERSTIYEELVNETRIQPRRGAESWLFSTTTSMIEM